MLESDDLFSVGDIFYTRYNDKFHIYKLLKVDSKYKIYHVLSYSPLDELPEIEKISELEIKALHFPIAISGFNNPTLLTKTTLTVEDYQGYYFYLKATGNYEELVAIANEYYNEANLLSELKQHKLAIEKHSIAIDLFPQFYESIDNRAFCKMDAGMWEDAIEDFKLSLTVNPGSYLAEFSIGECYMKMGNYKNAILQFQKAISIDPKQKIGKNFLQKALELDQQSNL